jgi:hypothetical protein
MARSVLDIIFKGSDKISGPARTATKAVKGFAGGAASAAKGVTRLAKVSTVAVGAIGAFVKVNADAVDRLGKTSEKLGINVELLQKMRFAAEQTGIAQNTLDMALQRFIRRVGEAQNGTGEAKGALEELGIQLKNSDGSLRSTEQVLFDVADGIQNTEDASTRLRLAFKFFDSEGAALVNTLKNGSDGLESFFKEAETAGIIIDDTTVTAFENFSDSSGKLFQQISTVTKYIVAAFLPILQKLVENLSKGIEAAAKLAGGFKELGRTIAVNIVDGLEKAVIAMANFSNAVTSIFTRFGIFEEATIDIEALKQKFDNIRGSITAVEEPIKKVNEALGDTTEKTKKLSAPVMSFLAELTNTEQALEKLTVSTMKKFEDSIIDSLKSGKLEFKKFADYVIEQLLRIAIQRMILAPITGKVENFFKSIGFEGGGFTGYGARAGGVDGRGGFPAILHPNETVIDHTKGQSIGGAVVNFNISTVDASGFDQLLASRKGMITAMINNAMNSRGKMGVV